MDLLAAQRRNGRHWNVAKIGRSSASSWQVEF
jgi:hypothetical protein